MCRLRLTSAHQSQQISFSIVSFIIRVETTHAGETHKIKIFHHFLTIFF